MAHSSNKTSRFAFVQKIAGLLALLAIAAMIGVNSMQIVPPTPIEIRAIDDQQALDLAGARALLDKQATKVRHLTRRADHPFWLQLEVPPNTSGKPDVILVRDKYLRQIELWSFSADGKLLVHEKAERSSLPADAALKPYDDGYAVWMEGVRPAMIIARVHAVGAAKLQASRLSVADFNASQLAKERLASGVTSALLAVSILMGIIGLLSRSRVLAICSAWIATLWMVTVISMGYDVMWVPFSISSAMEIGIKQSILVAFGASTLGLFIVLFKRLLVRLGHLQQARTLLLYGFGSAAVAAPFTPNMLFMPPFWGLALTAIGYMTYIEVIALARRPNLAARTFAWLWGFISLSILAEIAYAAAWIPRLPGVSFETGAVFGAMLAAYASAGIFRSERLRSFALLKRSSSLTKRYRRMYGSVPIGMVTLDRTASILTHNRLATELLSAPQLGKASLANVFGSLAPQLAAYAWRADTPEAAPFEATMRSRDQARTLNILAIHESDGIQVAISDISAHAELEQTLRRQLTHDHLTGTLSWYGLDQTLLSIEAERSSEHEAHHACLHLNIDNFSAINQVFGRYMGDEVLLEVVRRIRHLIADDQGIVSRSGADDFVILIRGQSLDAAKKNAESLVLAIGSSAVQFEGMSCSITASIGIAFLLPGLPAAEAVDQAGRACQAAKRAGGDRLNVFDPSPSSMERYRDERAWQSLATHDRLFDDLEIWAQPIVPLQDPEGPLGIEALLRVRRNGTLHSPLQLLEAAARTGRMPAIDRWVVSQVFQHLTENPKALERVAFVTINLSGASLNSQAFTDDLRAILHQHYLFAHKICIEITEQVAVVDMRSTRRLIDELRMFGVRIALDDFGAGSTSFAYLRDLAADVLKMDGAYVRDLEHDPANARLVQGIALLGRTFGMKSIAEWIETEETARLCASFGIEFGQGYLFARPAPIIDWLSGKASLDDARARFLTHPAHVSQVLASPARNLS